MKKIVMEKEAFLDKKWWLIIEAKFPVKRQKLQCRKDFIH